MLSLIRLSRPRHAVRRPHVGLVRHPATKVVATPLVTATAVMAMESAGFSSSALPHESTPSNAADASTPDTGSPDTQPFTAVTQATVPAPTTATTLPAPAPSTSAAGTPLHLRPTATTRPRPRAASATSKPAPKPPAAAFDSLAAAARAPHTARTTAFGVFAGSGDPAGVAAFAAVTGTHPSLASDYLLRTDGWAGMDGAGGSENWMLGQWRTSGYRLVLGVPIIPSGSGGSLAQGATGAYNQYFTTLAHNLIAGGASNAILRLGWEFDGNWYPWAVANNTDAANFAAYWRQIVNTMRAVPGAQFSFLWNPNGGASTSFNLDLAYPGSAYVDFIGTEVYDEYWGSPSTPQASWSSMVNQTWGLNWLVNFAASEGRPIAIPEWSVSTRSDGKGLGDDPYFVDQFAAWVAQNDVAFTSMFAFNDTASGQDDNIIDGTFPNALAALRATFG